MISSAAPPDTHQIDGTNKLTGLSGEAVVDIAATAPVVW